MLVLLWIIYTACCCYGVSRAIDWFPAQFAREESELINAIIRQHEAGQPVTFATLPVDDTPAAGIKFWRLPDFKFRNLLVILCVVLVNISAVFCLGDTYRALAWTIFGGGLLALAFIDARIKMLPDALTLPLLWLGLLIQLFPETRTVGLELSVIGVLAGYVPLWLFSQAYRLIRKRQGLGMGDLKLLAAMGAWSGAAVLPVVILTASVTALVGYGLLRIYRKDPEILKAELPFGPWIIIGYAMALIVLA